MSGSARRAAIAGAPVTSGAIGCGHHPVTEVLEVALANIGHGLCPMASPTEWERDFAKVLFEAGCGR